ncbi:MAG: hypothetical protein ACRCW2_09545 [Cellulosilyticaceae bacterium]
MRLTVAEGATYIALYFWGIRSYCRILRRFYFFGMPFTSLLEWAMTIGLLVFFVRTILRHESYVIRMIYFVGISTLPYWIRMIF